MDSILMPFGLDSLTPTTLVGMALWALGLYWGFSPVNDRLIQVLHHWLSFDQGAALSSVISALVFLGVGAGLEGVTERSLGLSWAISWGLILCITGGIYDLGRQDARRRLEKQKAKREQSRDPSMKQPKDSDSI